MTGVGVLQTSDPAIATTIFINDIQKLIKISTSRMRRRTTKARKPYITSAILKSIRSKEKLYNLYKMDKSNELNRTSYLKFSKILTKVINKAHIAYEKCIISAVGNNNKKVWNYVNDKMKNNVKSGPIEQILDDDNGLITEAFDIANKFNDFYTNVGENLASKIVKPKGTVPMPGNSLKSLFFEPITKVEIEKIIRDMTVKAGGCDSIGV